MMTKEDLKEIRDYANMLPQGLGARAMMLELLDFIENDCVKMVQEAWVQGRLEWWASLQGATYVIDDQAKEELRGLYEEAERRYPK